MKKFGHPDRADGKLGSDGDFLTAPWYLIGASGQWHTAMVKTGSNLDAAFLSVDSISRQHQSF
jgi:hypothetical protein